MRQKLTVMQAKAEDVYKDIIRVHAEDRGPIREGTICKVTVGDRSKLLAVRGMIFKGHVQLDEACRAALGLKTPVATFELTPVGKLGELLWYLGATDPSVRVSAWVSVWSFISGIGFGVIGTLLTIWTAT